MTALLVPYRSLSDMLVIRALSHQKICCVIAFLPSNSVRLLETMQNLMRRGELLDPSRSNDEERATIEREKPLREQLIGKMPKQSQEK